MFTQPYKIFYILLITSKSNMNVFLHHIISYYLYSYLNLYFIGNIFVEIEYSAFQRYFGFDKIRILCKFYVFMYKIVPIICVHNIYIWIYNVYIYSYILQYIWVVPVYIIYSCYTSLFIICAPVSPTIDWHEIRIIYYIFHIFIKVIQIK